MIIKKGSIIKCHNNIFEVVAINEKPENPYFKYELACINDKNANHPYFMGDEDLKSLKHPITIIKE